DKGLILNKRDRQTLSIARYIQMKNKGYDNEYIAVFLGLTERQLNKLVRNSGINISSVRSKTKKLEILPDIVLSRLKGASIAKISLKYKIDIVLLKQILYEFGLCNKI
ncbi:MAG: hypothetical protein ACTSP3_17965, partial [Candidatus Heimdallarchaeaceae archaeon]